MKRLLTILPVIIILLSCSHKATQTEDSVSNQSSSVVIGVTSHNEGNVKPVRILDRKSALAQEDTKNFIPNATAFRMNGDYSKNVAITLSSDGEIIYFPAPSDITADSEPIPLVEGWWLNCQGFGPNSVFTKYTFSEYAALPEVPSPEQLKMDIIPGARVTQFIELPIKIGNASNELEKIKDYLNNR